MAGFFRRLLRGRPDPLRAAHVAGHLYPSDPKALRALVTQQLTDAHARTAPLPTPPRALILPSGDLTIVGETIADGWAAARGHLGHITRVLILGSAQRIPFQNIAVSSAAAWDIPGGHLWTDREATAALLEAHPEHTRVIDAAHEPEVVLETHLPHLRAALGEDVTIIPLLAGDGGPEASQRALDHLWDDRTLALLSTELSHELSADEAAALDTTTARLIEALDGAALTRDRATARVPLRALLDTAKARDLTAHTLSLTHTGHHTGWHDRVAGIGAFALV